MSELTLVGLDEDGEHVVLEGPDGQRFRVRIDDALRAAVRRDRPQLEQVRAEAAGVSPREIQSRIRAGATAEEVAEEAGMPVEIVRRYDGPVLAEREYVAQQAMATRIGHESGAPVLGDLVTDRLATRDVAPSAIAWDAYRSGTSPWTVEVRFTVGGAERSARWTYDAGNRRVRALDDEARWLSETELADEPIPRGARHLTAVRDAAVRDALARGANRDAVFDIEVDDVIRPLLAQVDLPAIAEPEPEDPTTALLDDLADRRGVRQEADLDADDDEFPGFGPQHAFDFENSDLGIGPVPAAHPPASRPEEAVDARVLQMPGGRKSRTAPASSEAHAPDDDDADSGRGDGVASAEHASADHPHVDPHASRPRGRKARASVPSWDEIVFGAKHD
jgi:hypothetical protein